MADSAYDGDYDLYAYASVSDDTLDINDSLDWEPHILSGGSVDVSEAGMFQYEFDENDVGSQFSIFLCFETMVVPDDDLVLSNGDQIVIYSDFFDGLKITGINGGIEALDNGPEFSVTVVPIPATGWLFVSGFIGIAGFRKKLFA